jgi:shikimate dehydrogenase
VDDGVSGTLDRVRGNAGPDATLVGVIGSPITHSLSPLLHRAAFRALGLDGWESHAIEVPAGEAQSALAGMRSARFTGLSVTMPHKTDVLADLDECSAVAQRLGAVNCIVNRDGRLEGANTDGEGFVASVRRGTGFDPRGRRCLVAGAGGAARAVVLALAEAGASEVAVMNRTASKAEAAAELAGHAGRAVAVGDVDVVAQADLVVNATPVGMVAGDELAVPLVAADLLHPGQVAADLVYVPRPTAWLVAAADVGAQILDGLGMLVHQAAAQMALWTGLAVPVEAMWEAVEGAS